MTESKKYYKKLDYIRIISCILVLLYHLNLIKGGFLAVCTFFVFTGYLECTSALKSNDFSIKEYYKKRLKRIYLPLLIVLSITVIIFKLVTYVNWLNLKPEVISAVFGYNNFWQLHANLNYFTKNISSPLIHIWYISILIQFDLIFPLIYKLFERINSKKKFFGLKAALSLGIITTTFFINMAITKNIMIVYYNSLARSFSIIWGIILALFHHNYGIRLKDFQKKNNKFIFIGYSLLLVILCLLISDKSNYYYILMIITTLISCRLIEYSVLESTNKKNNIIDFISKSTYEIYLVQYPVIFYIQNLNIISSIKKPLIIILTILIAIIINQLINKKFKNQIINTLKTIVIIMLLFIGTVGVLTEKDNTKEMNNLENKLNDNLKLLEQKNKEYLNNSQSEEEEWTKLIEEFDNDEEKVVNEQLKKLPIVGIGDSVFLDAVPELYKRFPKGYFDGKVSRSILGGMEVINKLNAQGKLSNIVILSLATNSDYVESWNKDLMKKLGNREIYWINAVGGDDPDFNKKFVKFAKNYKNIHIVDWEGAAKGHKDYFYVDGIHPKDTGVKKYVDTIYDTIYKDYANKYQQKKDELVKQKDEEEKKKITFYGNDALTNSYDYLQESFKNAAFNVKSNYQFDKLYNDIKNKVNEKKLEYNIILVFDKESNLTNNKYQKIIDLCKDYKIYICNIDNKDLSIQNKNVKIINLYDKIKDDKEYFVADKIHLSEKGNKLLAKLIKEKISIKE